MRRSATMTAAIGLGLGLALGTTGWAAAQPTTYPTISIDECRTRGGSAINFGSNYVCDIGDGKFQEIGPISFS